MMPFVLGPLGAFVQYQVPDSYAYEHADRNKSHTCTCTCNINQIAVNRSISKLVQHVKLGKLV